VGQGKKKKKEDLSSIHGEKCWPLVDKRSPCEEACPIHMDIPSYVMALAQGRIPEALDIVRRTNPFPSICGRVCHHPCEEACTRALIDRPVAIEWLKREIARYEQRNGGRPPRIKKRREEKVAVIGSGPAGLTAAYDLALKGYRVSVFEALPVAGGMMAAAIPDFNLPSSVVRFEVDYIRHLGVEIKTNTSLGRDFTLEDLQDQGYRAILLATGAWKSPDLPIPGTELRGFVQALPFLREVKLGEKRFLKGKTVIIGGGNVAVDAARTAVRLGAEKVILACLESRPEMPAFPWEIQKADDEGVTILPSLAPQKILPGKGGKVKGVVFARVAALTKDAEGRLSWKLAEGETTLEADWVIAAIGQIPDPPSIPGLAVTERGTVQTDPETLATPVSGIFAAGDAVRYPGTIVEAIAAGHRAAKSINHFLKGKPLVSKSEKKGREVFRLDEKTEIPAFLVRKERWDMPALSPKDAVRSFEETELGYTPWQAREEAKRCLNCRMCGQCIFDKGQLCFETSLRLL
jgi:NADPH-dependent glutamate synthase beta subunit-like oxidoreductase